jgi:L-Ala-D/L-Glu epimerase
VELVKRHALTISRGTSAGSTNVVVSVTDDGVTGIGEMAPSEVTEDSAESAEAYIAALTASGALEAEAPSALQRIEALLGPVGHTGSAVRAAIDLACHDWVGKVAGLPTWRVLGVDRTRCVATSLTIGINPPDVVEDKTGEILRRTRARVLKVKLGQPAGWEADQVMFDAAQRAAHAAAAETGIEVQWRVDANGGWDVDSALRMIPWLRDRGVTYVEQPLAQGQEEDLAALRRLPDALPVFADESIRDARDVARFAGLVDGVNLKLMKCGGIAPALRIIHTARAHGLSVMIGCMGESSLAISGAAQIGGLCDHLDLDSHLNLLNDPFDGATYVDGVVAPNDRPGLGVSPRAAGTV